MTCIAPKPESTHAWCNNPRCEDPHTKYPPPNGEWTDYSIQLGNEGGEHKDDGKPAVQYLEPEFLEGVGRAMGYGAKKYAERNYRKGIKPSRLVASVLRHIFAWMRREDNDPESGLPHLYHAGASLNMLVWMVHHKKELDDR